MAGVARFWLGAFACDIGLACGDGRGGAVLFLTIVYGVHTEVGDTVSD